MAHVEQASKKATGKNRQRVSKRQEAPYRADLQVYFDKAFYNSVQPAIVTEIKDERVWLKWANAHDNTPQVAYFLLNEHPQAVTSEQVHVYVDDPVKPEQLAEPLQVSYGKAQELLAAAAVEQAKQERRLVDGFLVSAAKGGYVVALLAHSQQEAESGKGLRAYLPAREATLHQNETLDVFEQPLLQFVVKDFDLETGSLIVTRRPILLADRAQKADAFWAVAKVGDKVSGIVRSIVSYGAFVDIGGVDALLHASDISWDHAPHVQDVLKIGQLVEAKLLELDPVARKLKIGIKQMTPDPWETLQSHYQAGSEVEGVVVALTDSGVFVKLAEGIEGFVHLSEISWQRVKHPSQRFHIGDAVKARVIGVDAKSHRMSLSTKAIEKSPIDKLSERFPVGAVLKTHIARLADFGVFVDLGEGVLGLVHVSELSHTKRVEHPKELHQEGDEVEVVVLGYDTARQRVSCSIKQATVNPWNEWQKKYQKGTKCTGVVTKHHSNGVDVELEPGLTGYCGLRELSTEPASRPQDMVKLGQSLDVLVTLCDPKTGKIQVSVRALQDSETQEAYAQYLEKQSLEGEAKTTLADAIHRK